jgi:Protein of unknown function (DUF4238)
MQNKELAVRVVFRRAGHHVIRMADGTDSDWIDKEFMKPVETGIPMVVAALVDASRTTGTLHTNDRRAMALFIALLWHTVPKQLARAQARVLRDATESDLLEVWKRAHPFPPADAEALRQFALGRSIQAVLGEAAGKVGEAAWQLFRVEPGSTRSLILGDDPVIEYALPGAGARAYTLLALPLDPRTLLVCHPFTGADEPPGDLAADDLQMINRQVWWQAETAVVGLAERDLDDVAAGAAPMLPPVLRKAALERAPNAFGR